MVFHQQWSTSSTALVIHFDWKSKSNSMDPPMSSSRGFACFWTNRNCIVRGAARDVLYRLKMLHSCWFGSIYRSLSLFCLFVWKNFGVRLNENHERNQFIATWNYWPSPSGSKWHHTSLVVFLFLTCFLSLVWDWEENSIAFCNGGKTGFWLLAWSVSWLSETTAISTSASDPGDVGASWWEFFLMTDDEWVRFDLVRVILSWVLRCWGPCPRELTVKS